jgi:heat shock protein HslJ
MNHLAPRNIDGPLNHISGSGGRNHYVDELARNSDILFENIRSTTKACLREDGHYDIDLMEAEQYFLSVLSSAKSVTTNEGELRIFNSYGDELRFAPEGGCR